MNAQTTESSDAARGAASGQPRRPEPMVPAGTGRAVIIGTMIGFVVVFAFAFGSSMFFGASLIGSIGVGAFTAFWGGPGFGGMMGFVLHDAKTHKE